MSLQEIAEQVNACLNSGLISSRTLLDRMRLLDENSRSSSAYTDPRYAPFYYHLGKFLKPENMIEMGANLGLLSSCFLRSCKTVKNYLGFQERKGELYTTRLGLANIKANFKGPKEIYVGKPTDQEFLEKISPISWDLAIFNEEVGFDKHLLYLELVWQYMAPDGVMVVEYIERHKPAGEAFKAFCESQNRVPVVFDTRYGTAIIQK